MAPITDPNVEKIMIKLRFNSADVAIKPEKVKITSEGIGGKIFSIAISKRIPI